jgi:hypothetical protein
MISLREMIIPGSAGRGGRLNRAASVVSGFWVRRNPSTRTPTLGADVSLSQFPESGPVPSGLAGRASMPRLRR